MRNEHSSINPDYSIKKVTDLTEFEKLRPVWDGLADKQGAYKAFLCFGWFETWLSHFLKNNKLLILLLYKKDEISAIAPLYIKEENFKGVSVKKIELIGNVYSHIKNIILNDQDRLVREQALLAIFNYINSSIDWDIVDLNMIPEEKLEINTLHDATWAIGLKSINNSSVGNWYLNEINFSGDQYIHSRTSNIRNNIKRYRRSLQKMGKLEFIMVTDESDEKIDHFMDYYYAVYYGSWKKREGDPTFHRDLAKLARDKGWLRLGLLLLNDKPIASQLWLVCEQVVHIIKLAYDENYKKFIPGIILSSEMMKYVIDIDKAKEIDYGIGDDPYKKDWTPSRRERKGIIIFNNNIKGRYLFLLDTKILPMINKYRSLRKIKELIRDKFVISNYLKR